MSQNHALINTDARLFSMIPLVAGRKNPAIKNWKPYQSKKASAEQVSKWQDEGKNLGIVTGKISGVVVIDLDSEEAIVHANEKGLPATPAIRTPRGEHHYFRCPDDPPRNGIAVLKGIDFRGEGGYVVAAGSKFVPTEKELADGKVAGDYQWIEGTEQLPFADLPQWFVDACETNKPVKTFNATVMPNPDRRYDAYVEKAIQNELSELKSTGEGSRNHRLNKAAFALGQFVGGGYLKESVAGHSLMAAAMQIGLDEAESQKTIASGLASGIESPRVIPDERSPSTGLDFGRLQKNVQARQDIDEHPIGSTTIEAEIANLDPDDMSSLSEVSAQLSYAASFGDFLHSDAIAALTKRAHEIWDDSSTVVDCMAYGHTLVREYDAEFEVTKSGDIESEVNVHSRPCDGNGKPLPRLKTIDLKDIKPVLDGNWLIKGVMPARGTSCTYGHSGTFKSFFMLDMGLHVAHGRDWLGRKTEKGLVVYVAAEGQVGMQNRIVAWMRENEGEDHAPFVLIPTAVNMRADDADLAQLVFEINEAIDRHDEEPALIVIDTLSKSLGGGDENTSDMAHYMDNANRVAEGFECMVNIVHHRGKTTDNKEPRGHSSFKAGLDNVILMEAKGDQVIADVTKQKEGETGLLCTFGLNIIELGDDVDGEMQTSCVIEKVEQREMPQIKRSPRELALSKLSPQHRIALNCLGEELEHNGLSVPAEIPEDFIGKMIEKVVAIDTWSDRFFRQYLSDRTGPDKKPDSARTAFSRARDKLQSKDLIGVYDNFVWIK